MDNSESLNDKELLYDGRQQEFKWAIGRVYQKVTIRRVGDRMWFSFGFNKEIQEIIKNELEGRWHGFEDPPIKMWSAPYNEHTVFRLRYHAQMKPYAIYDKELDEVSDITRPLKRHQIEGLRHLLTRKQHLLAYEMGLGNTLITIDLIERSRIQKIALIFFEKMQLINSVDFVPF